MIDGVAVQHAAAQLFQRPQSAGFPGASRTCDPNDQRAGRFYDMEARCLFQTVAHRQSQAAFIRTLGEDLCHVGTVEGTQGVKHMLRLRQLVAGRSQPVDGVTFKQGGIFIKADHAAVLCQMGGDICGGSARRAGDNGDRCLGGIMPIFHTGGFRSHTDLRNMCYRRVFRNLAEHLAEHVARYRAGAKQCCFPAGKLNYC